MNKKRTIPNDVAKYFAEVLKQQMKELNMSRYRLVKENIDTINPMTLKRILNGHNATGISTLAHYADILGLEIKIVKKNTANKESESK